MKRTRNALKDENAFTLVEVLVVIALVGIMALVSVNLIAALFDAQIRANQQLDQQTTIETMYGFLASRLATAQRPIGITTGSGSTEATDPLSISGDQIMFTSQGNCYRVFFVKRLKQVRAAVAGQCTDSQVKPVRGPNQEALNGTYIAAPSDQDYDIALDKPPTTTDASFVLVDGIVTQKPDTAPASAPDPLIMFDYEGEDAQPIVPAPDSEAFADRNGNTSPNHSSFYDPDNLGLREDISAVNVTAYVDPIAYAQGGARVNARYYRQNMSLQQVCAVPGSGSSGATPGSVWIHSRLDGAPNGGWRTVASNGGAYETVQTSGSGLLSPLASEDTEVPTQLSWFNFDGVVTVKDAGQPYSIRVRLMRDATGYAQSDDNIGRDEFVFQMPANNSSTPVSIPIRGAFKLPFDTTEAGGTNYKIEVQIATDSGSIDYNTDDSMLWLNYEVVAY